ncbi:MAG: DUF6516 family protein [Syntrophobacteraceae bacterium]
MAPSRPASRFVSFMQIPAGQTADGLDVIRYDNERGKGDHRHTEGQEDQYSFETVKRLVLDFYEAVRQTRKNGGIR